MFTLNFYRALARSFTGLDSTANWNSNNPYYSTKDLVNMSGASESEGYQASTLGTLWTRFCALDNTFPTMKRVKNTFGQGGTYLGTGTTAPTINDYTFAGEMITTFTSSTAISCSVDDNGCEITALHTLTNTGDAAFTVGEILLFGMTTSTASADGKYYYLVERQVLDTPVTIEPGGVGQVTHKVRYNFPTA